MAPNVNIPIENQIEDHNDDIIVQWNIDGSMTDNVANQTEELEAAIQSMPPFELYIGCVNCAHPITLALKEVRNIVSAYVIPWAERSRINQYV